MLVNIPAPWSIWVYRFMFVPETEDNKKNGCRKLCVFMGCFDHFFFHSYGGVYRNPRTDKQHIIKWSPTKSEIRKWQLNQDISRYSLVCLFFYLFVPRGNIWGASDVTVQISCWALEDHAKGLAPRGRDGGIHIQQNTVAILRVPRVLTHIPLEISGNSQMI